MMTTTDNERRELDEIWAKLHQSPEPEANETIRQLFPVLLRTLTHVDELQAEVRVLRERQTQDGNASERL